MIPINNNIETGKRAIIYLRVSTEEQVDNFSLDTQEEICRKEAEKRGFVIIDIFREEGRSAKNIIGRPILISLLEYCRKNKQKIQAVFVYRIDRISRITADYLAIRKKLAEQNVAIISATEPTGDSPTEKLVETILAGFAQLDNDIRSERSKNGLRARYLSGKLVTGHSPLGYAVESGYAVKDKESWDKMKTAWNLMATGTKSIREMTKIMNDWGLRENHRNRIYMLRPTRVNVLLRNKFYMGYLSSRTYKEQIKGQHVPMVTEEQFYRVQSILDGRNINLPLAKRKHTNPDFPLRRLIRCSKCGQGLTGGWSKGRHHKYGYYRCCNNECHSASIKVEVMEQSLISLFKKITPKKECLELFTSYMFKTFHERLSRLQKVKQSADIEIGRLKDLRKILVEKNIAGIYSDEIFKEQNSIIEEKMTVAQIAKEDVTFDKYNIDEVITFIRTLLADLGETYKKSSQSQIKVLIGSIFPSGLSWNYKGTLNHQLSPIYQSINTFTNTPVSYCADGGT